MNTKAFEGHTIVKTAQIKSTPTDGSGFFTAYVSTWDVDLDNERFEKGAFADSILRWKVESAMPPLLWHHDVRDPRSLIGMVKSMREDDRGLLIEAQLNLTNDRAVAAYEALLAGTLKTLSVGFIAHETKVEGGVGVILRAEIVEATLTPTPSNPRAQVLSVKRALSRSPEDAALIRRLEEVAGCATLDQQRAAMPGDPAIVAAAFSDSPEEVAARKAAERKQAAEARVRDMSNSVAR